MRPHPTPPAGDRLSTQAAVVRTRLTWLLVAASVASLSFLAVRFLWTGSTRFSFLPWNLLLAWLPYLASLAVAAIRRPVWVTAPLCVGWLLFWPNAPYILTDVVHLERPGGMPTWFDAVLVTSFALTGLLLGLASLYLMHGWVTDRAGAAAGWAVVLVTIPLGAVGVYLGRVHRFNSWDAVLDPLGLVTTLLADPSGPLSTPTMVVAVGAFSVCLAAAYAVLWRALTDQRGWEVSPQR